MKIFVKLMALLVILAVAGPFFLKGPDGRPLLSLQDIRWPDMKLPSVGLSSPAAESESASQLPSGPTAHIEWSKDQHQQRQGFRPDSTEAVAEHKDIYYRWRDQNGVWQFSKTPNPQVENFVVSVDINANVVQALSAEKIDKIFGRNQKPDPKVEDTADQPKLSPLPSTIPLEEIPKLIEQAKGLQKLADQRLEIMDKGL